MKSFRLPITVATLTLCVIAGILWWNRPSRTDMAQYAPADALLYLELNSLPELTRTIEQNKTWKHLAQLTGQSVNVADSWWLSMARAGVAPVRSVVFARAQFALLLVGLDSTEEGDTLKIRPHLALVVETHTSNWRIKGAAVDAVKQLANYAYGQSNCIERASSGTHFVECSSKEENRKLIGAIDGSVVIIGNALEAVEHCLGVRRGMRPSLHTDPEIQRLRENLKAESALSFGYISSAHAATIFSWTAPLLVGKAPGDQQIERMLSLSSSKIVRSISWVSVGLPEGFEDRYQVRLEPEVIVRLQPAFEPGPLGDFWRFVPNEVQSLTIYHQANPSDAWMALNSALAVKLDAVSAVLASTILRSALTSYGIANPAEVLPLLQSPLATLKSPRYETPVLIAGVSDPARLRQALGKDLGNKLQIIEGRKTELKPNPEFAALIEDGFVVLGRTPSVNAWVELMRDVKNTSSLAPSFEKLRLDSTAAVTTYTADSSRVNTFVVALATLKNEQLSAEQLAKLKAETESALFSITETSLNSEGIDRRTRSAFGQLSTLMSLLQSDSSSGSNR